MVRLNWLVQTTKSAMFSFLMYSANFSEYFWIKKVISNFHSIIENMYYNYLSASETEIGIATDSLIQIHVTFAVLTKWIYIKLDEGRTILFLKWGNYYLPWLNRWFEAKRECSLGNRQHDFECGQWLDWPKIVRQRCRF